MKCPNCYGKVNKITAKCEKCGFNTSQLKNSYNKPVKEFRKNGLHDEIIFSTVMPKDLTKKRMLLFCGFLGFFGGHNYIAQKNIRAIIQTISATLFLIYIVFYNTLVNYFIYTGPMLGGFCFLWQAFDFMALCFGYYKFPVVLDEKKVSL